MKKIILSIEGMTCSACSNGLEKYLNKQEGIISASVNLIMNSASIEYDDKKIKLEDLNRFVKEAGFSSLGKYVLNFEEKKDYRDRIKTIIIGILTVIIFYISMAHMFNFPEIPAFSYEVNPIANGITLFILTTIVIALGIDIVKSGLINLVHKTPNMDTLVTLGVLSGYLYSVYSMFQNDKLYFESSAMVIFFVKLGRIIENKNKNKTKEAIQRLVTITPKNAIIVKEGKEQTVTIDEVNKGDILVCRPGGKIAVDGEIVEGETHIDESFITGESKPVKKEISSKVLAGSINYDGYIKYKAEKIGRESTVSEIVKMVVEATNQKAPIGKIADSISGIFVPIVIILSIITFAIWMIITKDVSIAIKYFVSVLVVACPCSLGLATPLAIVVATGKATSKGILIKSGEALENARKINNILFDKTGTLTYGNLNISKLINYSEENDITIFKWIASIESKSEHPIAKSIVRYAENNNISLDSVEEFSSIPGKGVFGRIGNDEYYIGNRQIMIEKKISIDGIINDEEELTKLGNSILYIVKNDNVLALVGVKDTIRESSKELITSLKERKITPTMLTGDNDMTAKTIADELEIEEVLANCSPKDKALKVQELKKQGIVAMCGDGINDSISLVNADIGISIATGTDISINSANVILMNDNLEKIIELIDLSNKTLNIIKQNLFWAFVYNICMIPIASGLFSQFGLEINPIVGSAAMMISSIIVVLNSLRIKKF